MTKPVIGTKVKVIDGGFGARMANGMVATVIQRPLTKPELYGGKYWEKVSDLYVQNEQGAVIGLCDGYYIKPIKVIEAIVEKNRFQVHGAIGSATNFVVYEKGAESGHPSGFGESLQIAVESFIQDWEFKRDEEIEVKVIETKIV